jgi:hypothetical protein
MGEIVVKQRQSGFSIYPGQCNRLKRDCVKIGAKMPLIIHFLNGRRNANGFQQGTEEK